MYGVPANLDLRPFHGKSLTQVRLGEHDIQFCFNDGPVISVEGLWELKNDSGALVDGAQDALPKQRECYRIHLLLSATVTSTHVDPPHSFSLTFDDGMVLTVYDNNEQFESFSIQPGDVIV